MCSVRLFPGGALVYCDEAPLFPPDGRKRVSLDLIEVQETSSNIPDLSAFVRADTRPSIYCAPSVREHNDDVKIEEPTESALLQVVLLRFLPSPFKFFST
mmetsp:Transcript_67921/g.136674  ORF Transcript_67921/g.136674 Transcript_67921/m.136674 type:complete len:100 (-) Transcript_67921:1125-1424(-)